MVFVFLFLIYFTQYENLQLHPGCCRWHCCVLFMAEQYFIVYMYHIFFIHSSVSGHLGCFHVLPIVNSAAVSIGVHISFRISVFGVFWGYIPGNGITRLYSSSVFSFSRKVDRFQMFLSLFCLFRANSMTHGNFQARGQIGATSQLQPPQLSSSGFLTHWVRPGTEPASSWILVAFLTL